MLLFLPVCLIVKVAGFPDEMSGFPLCFNKLQFAGFEFVDWLVFVVCILEFVCDLFIVIWCLFFGSSPLVFISNLLFSPVWVISPFTGDKMVSLKNSFRWRESITTLLFIPDEWTVTVSGFSKTTGVPVCRVKVTASGNKHVGSKPFIYTILLFLFWLKTMFNLFPVVQNKWVPIRFAG